MSEELGLYRGGTIAETAIQKKLVVLTSGSAHSVSRPAMAAVLQTLLGPYLLGLGAPLSYLGVAMCVGALASVIAAIVLFRQTRRRLLVVEEGHRRFLTIPRANLTLEFPLSLSGETVAHGDTNVVRLKAIGADGRAVVFEEPQHVGAQMRAPWFESMEQDTLGPTFETSHANMIVELRDLLSRKP